MKQPLNRNAADEEQVREAAKKVKFGRDRELSDLRAVLRTMEGRRLLWRLLGHCRVNGSVWEPSAKIHYNSGQQDVGHFVMSEIVEAGEEFLFQMMREARGEEHVG